MTFFSNLSPSWTKYSRGYVPSRSKPNPHTFLMPNTTSPFPPNHPNQHIISSSWHAPDDNQIYSGIEPLQSINTSVTALATLFGNTTIPGTAPLVYNPHREQRRQHNQYQQPTTMGVEYWYK